MSDRRVLLQRPGGVDERGRRLAATSGDTVAYATTMDLGRRQRTSRHPVVRLTGDGIDWGVKPQPGDEIGYGMDPYRGDDCLAAAIATATQVPIEQAPDLRLDARTRAGEDPDDIARESWERIERWASKRGLLLVIHRETPAARRRWIGVVRTNARRWDIYDSSGRLIDVEELPFSDHCLVMDHDRLIFDPSVSVRPPPGTASMQFHPEDIYYGISFDTQED